MRTAYISVYLLVIANGLFADAVYRLYATTEGIPISPVLLVIVVAGCAVIARSPMPHHNWGLVWLGLLCLGALIPSSVASWATLFVVSAFGLIVDSGRRRVHQLPLALATTQLWKALVFKVAAGPIVETEAWLLGGVLRLFNIDAAVIGNVVRISPEHSLVLLAGCSAFSDLGLILLGWIAVNMLIHPDRELPLLFLAGIAASVVGFNILRLLLMSLSPSWHAWMHDGMGAALYDAALCVLVVTAGFIDPRRDARYVAHCHQASEARA